MLQQLPFSRGTVDVFVADKRIALARASLATAIRKFQLSLTSLVTFG